MNDFPSEGNPRKTRMRSSANCSHCGASLNPYLYFCPKCAAPYRNEDEVLSKSLPPPLTNGDRVAKLAPKAMPMFWVYFTAIIFGAISALFLFGPGRGEYAFFFQLIVLLIPTVFYSIKYWPTLKSQFSGFGFGNISFWHGLLLLVPLLAVNYGYHGIIRNLLELENISPVERFREMGLGSFFIYFSFCIFPAFTEEIAFRGLLQHWLQKALRPATAIVYASGLFAVLHFSIVSAPYLFLVGCLLGWAKWKTGSLFPPIVLHFLHNFLAIELFR